MYTVLLVDDEESVLHILRSSIEWQGLGVDQLLTAMDGGAALELFGRQRIDLLVTDIRMPGMDGLELIRRARGVQPDAHCVLLTAYGEFEYAQQAISLGVDNYLLKPVSREEVSQTIRSVLNNIYQNRRGSGSSLKENTLRRWATGMIGAEELGERAAALGFNLYYPAYCVLCLVPRDGAQMGTFRHVCMEYLQQYGQCEGFWDERGRYVAILCGRSLDTSAYAAHLEDVAQELQMQGRLRLSIGTVVSQYELLHASYQAACDALELMRADQDRVAAPPIEEAGSYDMDLLSGELSVLLFDTKDDSREAGFRHLVEKLSRRNKEQEVMSLLCRSCVHVLTQEFPLQETLAEQIYLLFEEAPATGNVQEGKACAVRALQAVESLFLQCLSHYSPAVQRMIRSLRRLVLNGGVTSIKEFAADSGVTPAYLGHLFKQETGIFFNDYLLHCRLERAVILLRNPNRKIKDIAENVGFASTSYFVKCFREYKGVSPARYRQTWEDAT